MSRLSCFLLVIAMAASAAFAGGNPDTAWQQANQLYTQKSYDSAALLYEHAAMRHPGDATLYYNLGNAYYRLNRIGPAVLNFQRALHYRPGFQEARDNLLIAEQRIPNRIAAGQPLFFQRWWQALTNPGLAGLWGWSAGLLFALFFFWLAWRRWQGKAGRIPAPAYVAAIGGSLLLLWISLAAAQRIERADLAVVMQDGSALEAGAASGGKPLSLIPEGTSVSIGGRSGDYRNVTLPDSRSGWMREDALAIVK